MRIQNWLQHIAKWGIKNKGLLLTLIVSLYLTSIMFAGIFGKLNTTYFGKSGDGLKAYYSASYHAKYDTSFWHFKGMNYPYGDQILFTDSQPVVSNTIKAIKPAIDLSTNTTGIINFLMILSVVITPLVIYLLFKRLKIPEPLSIICALGISFLSPQLGRMSGHYSLSFSFIIPLVILLLVSFSNKKTYKKSLIIGLVLFFTLFIHPYYFPMIGFVLLFYFGVELILSFSKSQLLKTLGYLSLQIILPYFLFSVIMVLSDSGAVRTSFPWGFWEFQSNVSGVFHPFGMGYEQWWIDTISPPKNVSWEGVAYIGGFAMLTFTLLVGWGLYKLVFLLKDRELSQFLTCFKNYSFYFAILLGGVFALFYSFGYPFVLDDTHESIQLVGVAKQFRAVGRMNWVFFYAINICAVAALAHLIKKNMFFWIPATIFCFVLLYDSSFHIKKFPKIINNEIPGFSDYNFSLPENDWLNHIDHSRYQAIIPLPFFHIGSENLLVHPKGDVKTKSFITSNITGLPITACMMSRTPINLARKSIQLHKEPYRKPGALNDFSSNDPFLVIADTHLLRPQDQIIFKNCKVLTYSDNYVIGELPFSYFENAYKQAKESVLNNIPHFDSLVQSTSSNIILNETFNKNHEGSIYSLSEDFTVDNPRKQEVLSFVFKSDKEVFSEEAVVSIWLNDLNKDLVARGRILFEVIDEAGNARFYNQISFGDHIVAIDKEWGLFEKKLALPVNKTLRVSLLNDDISKNTTYSIDNLLIRKGDVYSKQGDWYGLNNRFYQ